MVWLFCARTVYWMVLTELSPASRDGDASKFNETIVVYGIVPSFCYCSTGRRNSCERVYASTWLKRPRQIFGNEITDGLMLEGTASL